MKSLTVMFLACQAGSALIAMRGADRVCDMMLDICTVGLNIWIQCAIGTLAWCNELTCGCDHELQSLQQP